MQPIEQQKTRIRKSLVKEFSDMPGPRKRKAGPNSGEEFREECLIPWMMDAIKHEQIIEIDLDGAFGLPVSFTEEAFGGLQRFFIREHYKETGQFIDVRDYMEWFCTDDLTVVDDINYFIENVFRHEAPDRL